MFKRLVDVIEWVVLGLAAVTVMLLFTVAPTAASVETPDSSVGAEVFVSSCAGCHSSDGSGGIGPALTGNGALARFDSTDDLARFIAVGSPGRMPGFETRLSPNEINAIAEYLAVELSS